MKNLLDVSAIIKLKEQGLSNRGVAKTLGIDKKTVNKYWNEYKENLQKLGETDNEKEILNIQENIVSKPKYNSENRVRRKVTPEFLNALEKILEDEEKKLKVLGTNKQALTKQQIYELLKKQGFSLSYSTVVLEMKRIKNSGKECFIRQDYDFGDRLEYDFGEVKLVIDGIVKRYYLAVLSSPAGNFRWCYLYDNCKKDVFNNYENEIKEAKQIKKDYETFLDELLEKEIIQRQDNGIKKRLRYAKFPIKKYLEDFNKKLYNPEFIKEFEELESLEFIDKKENIILVRYTRSRKNSLCNRIRN